MQEKSIDIIAGSAFVGSILLIAAVIVKQIDIKLIWVVAKTLFRLCSFINRR